MYCFQGVTPVGTPVVSPDTKATDESAELGKAVKKLDLDN